MNKIISIVLVIVGLVFLLAPDYFLSKESENWVISTLYDYHQIVGGIILAGGAYYFYSNNKDVESYEYDTTVSSETASKRS
jgi:predicted nucleic-acid-binding protein